MRLCVLALCAFLFTGCDDESTLVPRDGDAITRERAAWLALDHHDYELTQERLCFCILGGQPVRLTIRGDTLFAGMLLADSSMLPATQLRDYHSVGALFDFVEDIDAAAVADFQLEFDSLYHFPSRVWVDYDRNIADEEIGYRSYDFKPL
ncbi:MAG: DUF6174 domain-containing protein [Bacteroidota bacterium]|nr:DUF6174 domain-containing protein [Bacteroidota bacterium]